MVVAGAWAEEKHGHRTTAAPFGEPRPEGHNAKAPESCADAIITRQQDLLRGVGPTDPEQLFPRSKSGEHGQGNHLGQRSLLDILPPPKHLSER